MGSVRLNFPMGSLEEWGDQLGISRARRRRIEEIVLGKKVATRRRARAAKMKASPRASRVGRKK